VALISHLPVLVSAALIHTAHRQAAADPEGQLPALVRQLASSGFADTTRVGGGNPELGTLMARCNQPALRQALAGYRRSLEALECQLERGDWNALQALLAGLNPPAVPPQPALRGQFSALGQETCHALLRQADPAAGARIAPADAVRTQRALEVLYASGRTLSSQQGRTPPPWRVLELGLCPADLGQRIQRRTRQLYREGLVAETEALIGRYGTDCPLLQTIGYGEASRLLRGELSEADAIAATERRTRQFAKRQRTWFRRQHRPLWLESGEVLQSAAQAPGTV
jgi:hypothetical protein